MTDAEHTECERLRAESTPELVTLKMQALMDERDAALDENERLRNAIGNEICLDPIKGADQWHDCGACLTCQIVAWRACADQLAAQVKAWGYSSRALAEYEQLRGADSEAKS